MFNSKSGVPLWNQNFSDVIDGVLYDTKVSEIIGLKMIDDKGLTANQYEILYRSPGKRFFVYHHEKIQGADPLIQKSANITLKPISQREAEKFFDELSDLQMTKNETFLKVVEA